jgi:thiol-disulfide isomerase/thioredoxin
MAPRPETGIISGTLGVALPKIQGPFAMLRYGTALVVAAIVLGSGYPARAQDSVPIGRVQPAGAPAETDAAEASAEQEPSEGMTIGDVAPALDVSDWVQDGGGKWEHVTAFKPGNIYIVEFWATWCGPCIASMPHISELQEKYADKGVQVVSVSDEPLETVTKFLKRTVPKEEEDEEERTYADVTANYCLTTDPDGSVHKDYMEAASQNGIPCAFLVGKDGKVEWIGHPMELDEVLAAVVDDAWDRDAFRAKFEAEQKLQREMSGILQLASAGDVKGANAKVDALAKELGDDGAESIKQIRLQIDLMAFRTAVAKEDAAAVELMPRLIEGFGGSPAAVGQVVSQVVSHTIGGGKVSDELRAASISALEGALKNEPGQYEAPLMMLIARLEENGGNKDAAIEWMKKSLEVAPEAYREQLESYLKELQGTGADAAAEAAAEN